MRIPSVAGLMLLDASMAGTAALLAYTLRFAADLLVWTAPICVGVFVSLGLYRRCGVLSGLREYLSLLGGCAIATLSVFAFTIADPAVSRATLIATWLLTSSLVLLGRFAMRHALRVLRGRGLLMRNALIVGANEEAIALAEQFLSDPSSGTRVVGFLDSELPIGTQVVASLEVLGKFCALDGLIRAHRVRDIVVATSAANRRLLLDLYWRYGHDDSVELYLSSGVYEILTTPADVRELGGVPLMTLYRARVSGPEAVLKTLIDYLLAASALLLLSPLLLAISLLVKLDSSGPVLHRRRVLGVASKPFFAFKFRTMTVDAEAALARDPVLRAALQGGQKLKDDPRVTSFGRVLRRTSLDELPQLINVLRGEMSIVGPRMIAPEEAPRYGRWQRNLVTVKPGITGPWQVAGRGDLPYEDRVKLSMQYIRNYTLWRDMVILLRTMVVVLKGKGAY